MPFLKEKASKTAHAEFIENPDITSLVEQSEYLKEPSIESAKQLADGYTPASDYESALPKYVYASDGSFYEASLDDRYPSTKVGYVKISSLILDVSKYQELSSNISPTHRYIDPLRKNELERDVRALSLALPSSNLRYNRADSVADGFRQRLYEDLNHEKTRLPNAGTMLNTLFRMSSTLGGTHGTRTKDGEYFIFIYKCPSCGHSPEDNGHGQKGYALNNNGDPQVCTHCSKTIYPSDCLRLHETITDHGGLSGGLSRIMNVSEYLLLAHTIMDCLRGDYLLTLSDLCFFIDGPLAFFGQPAWLHRPMMELIYSANKKLKEIGKPPFLMIGIQKQGTLADHSRMIARHLPRNHYRFVDDQYRNRHISPVPENGFGYETYFGQDIIYHTPKGNIFVLGLPYPFLNKSHPDFMTEKALDKNYPELNKMLKMTRIFEADIYEGSLIPIIIAHRNASISRMPGGKVLDIASRISFDRRAME
ncbi:MAG: hypothetical protein R3F02_07225 [Thiolinea sp.]